jgi:hypothetical protein
MHRIVLHFEAVSLTGRQTQVVEFFVFNVDYSVTCRANQVVMSVGLSVEPGPRAGMVQGSNHPQTDKRIEGPIHGGARETWNAVLDRLIYLVGRWMVVSLQDGLEDIPALYCQRQSPLAT